MTMTTAEIELYHKVKEELCGSSLPPDWANVFPMPQTTTTTRDSYLAFRDAAVVEVLKRLEDLAERQVDLLTRILEVVTPKPVPVPDDPRSVAIGNAVSRHR